MYICFVSPRSKTRWYYFRGETRMEKDRIFLWFSPIHSDVINELQFVSNSHQTNKINWHNLKYTDTKLAIENALLIKNYILRKPFIFLFHLFRQGKTFPWNSVYSNLIKPSRFHLDEISFKFRFLQQVFVMLYFNVINFSISCHCESIESLL